MKKKYLSFGFIFFGILFSIYFKFRSNPNSSIEKTKTHSSVPLKTHSSKTEVHTKQALVKSTIHEQGHTVDATTAELAKTDSDSWISWIQALVKNKKITQKLVLDAFSSYKYSDENLAVLVHSYLNAPSGEVLPLEWLTMINHNMDDLGPLTIDKLTLVLRKLSRRQQTVEERSLFQNTLMDILDKNIHCERCVELLSSGIQNDSYLNDLRKNPSLSIDVKNSISTTLAEFARPAILLELMKDQSLTHSSRKEAVYTSASIMKSMDAAMVLKTHVEEVGKSGKEGMIGFYRGLAHSPISYDEKEDFILKSLANTPTYEGMSPEEFGALELLAFGDKNKNAQTARKLAVILDGIPDGKLNTRDKNAVSVVLQFFAHCPLDQACVQHTKDSREFKQLLNAKLDLKKRNKDAIP